MAIAFSSKTTGNTGAVPASSPATASHTPASNTLQLLAVEAWDPLGATLPTFSSVTGNGLTWVAVGTLTSGGILRHSVYRALGASPSAGATTINISILANCSWCLVEATGIDTSGTNGSGAIVQTVTNQSASATTLSATLAAFANSNNRPFLTGEGEDPNTAITLPDFTQINVVNNFTGSGYIINLNTAWKNSVDLSPDVSQASLSFLQLIACEIAAEPVAGGWGHLLGSSRNRLVQS